MTTLLTGDEFTQKLVEMRKRTQVFNQEANRNNAVFDERNKLYVEEQVYAEKEYGSRDLATLKNHLAEKVKENNILLNEWESSLVDGEKKVAALERALNGEVMEDALAEQA